ncbi:MAG: fibronectin type III domain-containing protein, partial [Elusimicrobia bacterium]|nr:fibronectin type III domain-containing protein [Elusimicrobiota bacterium]
MFTSEKIVNRFLLIFLPLAFFVSSALFAAESLSGTSYKILRNEMTVGASTFSGTNFLGSDGVRKISGNFSLYEGGNFTLGNASESGDYALAPGFANLMAHPNAITDLGGTVVSTNGSVGLVWSAPAAIEGSTLAVTTYIVKWSSQSAISTEASFDAAQTFVQSWVPDNPGVLTTNKTVTGLPLGTIVYISIKSYRNEDYSYISTGSAVSGIRVSSDAVAAPLNVVGLGLSSASINWSWIDLGSNETGFRVVAASGGAISGNLAENTTYFIQTGLSGPNTSFAVRIVAFNAIEASSSTVTTAYSLTNTATNAAFVSVYGSSASLTWDANSNPSPVTSYRVEASSVTDFSLIQASSITLLNAATVQSLAPNTTYHFRIISYNYDNRASSPTLTITTMTLPVSPTLQNYEVTVTTITVQLNKDGNPVYSGSDANLGTFYNVQYSTDSGFGVNSQQDAYLANTTHSITGLTPNTTYFFRARSYNLTRDLYTPFISLGSTVTLSSAPTILSYAVNRTSFTISFSSNSNPAGTRFEISTAAVFTTAITSSGITGFGSPAVSLLSSNLLPNTTYTVYARALSHRGLPSASVILTTPTLAATPQAGTIASVKSSSLTVQWSLSGVGMDNSTGTFFQIERSTDSQFSSVAGQSGWSADLSSTPVNLLTSNTYYFRLRARNWAGVETDYSDSFSTNTVLSPPSIYSYNVNVTSFVVSLSSNGNPVGTRFETSTVTAFTAAITSAGITSYGSPAASLL